jgi:hypothetical protein
LKTLKNNVLNKKYDKYILEVSKEIYKEKGVSVNLETAKNIDIKPITI